LRSKRRSRLLSLISILAVGGVGLGVAALIVVLAVLAGFETNFKEKLLGLQAHVTVYRPASNIEGWREAVGIIQRVPGVASVQPVATGQVMAASPDGATGVIIKGIDPDLALKADYFGPMNLTPHGLENLTRRPMANPYPASWPDWPDEGDSEEEGYYGPLDITDYALDDPEGELSVEDMSGGVLTPEPLRPLEPEAPDNSAGSGAAPESLAAPPEAVDGERDAAANARAASADAASGDGGASRAAPGENGGLQVSIGNAEVAPAAGNAEVAPAAGDAAVDPAAGDAVSAVETGGVSAASAAADGTPAAEADPDGSGATGVSGASEGVASHDILAPVGPYGFGDSGEVVDESFRDPEAYPEPEENYVGPGYPAEGPLFPDMSDGSPPPSSGPSAPVPDDVSGPPERGIILGSELSMLVGQGALGEVNVISPFGRVTPIGRRMPLSAIFRVAGVFRTNLFDYDSRVAFVTIEDAQEMLGMDDTVSAIEIMCEDIYQAGEVRQLVLAALGPEFWGRDWMQMNMSLFSALKLEQTAMFVILTLIILVAAFNIASTLVMMVTEKTRDIAILKAMGATGGQIRRIFTIQGLAVGGAGTLGGFAVGVTLCLLLARYEFISLPPDVYLMSTLPVEMRPLQVAAIVAVSMIISYLATLYPSSQAARLDPVEAIRYE
jgi:ABC-type lipoprotein release transport system permease subunit